MRTVLDPRRRGIASVPALGRYNYSRANPALPEHRHRGAMEICYLARGRQIYSVGGRTFHLQGGDIFLTFPDESHGTDGEPEEKGLLYWMMLFDPRKTGGSLLGLSRKDSKVLWQSLISAQRRSFPGRQEMKSQLDAAIQSIQSTRSALSRVVATNHLTAFLLTTAAASVSFSVVHQKQLRFEKVFAHVETHLDAPDMLTVPALAKVAALSPSRFKVRFKMETGVPPAEYVLRARVAEAKERLGNPGVTITDVALDLGFSSSQYFAAVFKRLTGRTPTSGRQRPKVEKSL